MSTIKFNINTLLPIFISKFLLCPHDPTCFKLKPVSLCLIMYFHRYFASVEMYIKYFLDTIEHLICHKMCSKNFENQSTNKKVLVKNIFE